jgi:hypothetical protein
MIYDPLRSPEELALRRDDATTNALSAVNQIRLAMEKVARSQAWDVAPPFPLDLLPLLQEASRLMSRVHAKARRHAEAHVWPHRNALVAARCRAEQTPVTPGDSRNA